MKFTVRSKKDLEKAVEKYGFLPYFRGFIEGFSLEEHIDPQYWFTEKEGAWEWKGAVIRETGCAYGKFFNKKAVFISRELFPDFANYRRNGYDADALYDDGMMRRSDKILYDLADENAPVISKELKKLGGYCKGGNTGFDSAIVRLQEQCYVLTSDFVYLTDKNGAPYGWGVAEYSTPEKFMGNCFTENVYKNEPEKSYEIILSHLKKILPHAEAGQLKKLLG